VFVVPITGAQGSEGLEGSDEGEAAEDGEDLSDGEGEGSDAGASGGEEHVTGRQSFAHIIRKYERMAKILPESEPTCRCSSRPVSFLTDLLTMLRSPYADSAHVVSRCFSLCFGLIPYASQQHNLLLARPLQPLYCSCCTALPRQLSSTSAAQYQY
jgi:hypothetical protein